MRRLLLLCVMALAAAAPVALAAPDPDEKFPNVKYEGYKVPVKVEESSPLLGYVLLVFTMGVCVAIMFKDAKRSHLD